MTLSAQRRTCTRPRVGTNLKENQMGKKLSTGSQTMEPSVIVNVKGEEGQTFVGILKSKKQAP